jgi:hypothetical protein
MNPIATKPHYRLRVGKLADGRRAFAIATVCISAMGDYPSVSVWVNEPGSLHNLSLVRDRSYVRRGTSEYRRLFAMILNGEEHKLTGCPALIAQELGWF